MLFDNTDLRFMNDGDDITSFDYDYATMHLEEQLLSRFVARLTNKLANLGMVDSSIVMFHPLVVSVVFIRNGETKTIAAEKLAEDCHTAIELFEGGLKFMGVI